jgi:predicted nucleic acid-binding protein
LDANVLVKLVMNEPGSKEARANVSDSLKKGFTLHTVDLALAESLNAIWKHVNFLKDLKAEEAEPTMKDLIRVYDWLSIVTSREITEETARIALAHNITIYDSLYIAAAQKLKGTLYTADQQLCATANKVTNSKLLEPKP